MAELKLVEGWTGPIDDALKSNGAAVDLTNQTVALLLQKASGTLVATDGGAVTVVDAPAGLVRYTPAAGDLLARETPHVARWQVTDGAGRIVFFPNDAGEVWTIQPSSAVALPANALVTLAELKAHLKIQNTDQDLAVAGFLTACSDALETYTGRRLASRTYTDEYLRVSPLQVFGTAWFAVEAPITALTSLQIGGTGQTVWMPGDAGAPDAADVYVLEGRGAVHGRDRLYRPAGWPWDALVKRTYTAGYGGAGLPVPGDLKEAICVLAEDWYYKRDRQADPVVSRSSTGETVTYLNDAIPRRFQALIASYRRWD